MSSEYENLNVPHTMSVRVQIAELVFVANARALPARRVPLTAALMVADRVLANSPHTDLTARAFAVERAVTKFISLATLGQRSGELAEHLDLLPAAHPLSTAVSPLTASAFAEARAQWLAADPRITDELRPLVASAYTMEFGSIERTHALARLEAVGNDFPLDLIALVAVGGNSSAARSARARRQLRDRLKRFAFEGGMGGFLLRLGTKVKSEVGTLLGGSSTTGTAEVYITEDNEEFGLKKGDILPVSLDNYEALDVALTEEQLKKAGIELPDSEASTSKRAQDVKELLANKLEAPSDWKKLPNGDFVTEDGFTATPKGDLKYELKDENGNVVPGLEAAEWPDIQKHIKKVAEDEFGTGNTDIDSTEKKYDKLDTWFDSLYVGDLLPQYYPIKGAEANLLKKREADPNYELPPTDEIIGVYQGKSLNKRGFKIRDLKTGKERYFEVNKKSKIYDVRRPAYEPPAAPETKKAELPEPDVKKNTVTHVATKPFWHGMDYPAGTELIEAPDLEEKNGSKDGFKWFRAIDSKGVLHGVNLNDSEYKNVDAAETSSDSSETTVDKTGPEIKVGDVVVGKDGKRRTVTKKFSMDSGDKITFDDNSSLTLDEPNTLKVVSAPSVTPSSEPDTVSQPESSVVAKPVQKAAPKNKPSKKQKEMIRSMLLERVMTSEERQAYMDRLASIDKFDVNTLFNELKALPKAKVPLTDGTDPLNQHENPDLAKIKQKLAPFDLDGSIRRYIDEKTANGEEVSSWDIRDLLKGDKDFQSTASYNDYASEAQSLRSALNAHRTEAEKKAIEDAGVKNAAAKKALEDKLDALVKGQAGLTPLSKEEHQAALDKLVALISDENDPDYIVRGGILDGTLRNGDDIVKALRKQQIKNEYKNLVSTKFASQYGETADETKTPETWAIINAAYGLSPAPEGFEPQFVANSLRAYDNENKDLDKLINSGASSKEIFDWLDANSPSWKSRDGEYMTSWAVDLPTQLDKARWKKFSELKGTIYALDKEESSSEEQPNLEFVSSVGERLPENTISSLDSELGKAFSGDSLSELLGKVESEEDLQLAVDELSIARASEAVTPEQEAQLKQVQDMAIQQFYEDHPDLENTMSEPTDVIPAPVATQSPLDGFQYSKENIEESSGKNLTDEEYKDFRNSLEEAIQDAAADYLNGGGKESDPEFKEALDDAAVEAAADWLNFTPTSQTEQAPVEQAVPEAEAVLPELEKPSKPLGTKVYTFDYGFGPNEITVDGDGMYDAAQLVKAAYDLPEAKGLKKSDVDFTRGQIGYALRALDGEGTSYPDAGNFKEAAKRVSGSIENVRLYASKLKDEDAKAKLNEALDKAEAAYNKAYTEVKLSEEPTPYNEKSPDGEVIAKPVKFIPPASDAENKAEPAVVEPQAAPETVENPFSTANSDKLLIEAKTNRQEIDDVDSSIAVAIENAGVNYTPMLFGITGNEHIVKNILDDLDASDGANSIALSSSLYELQQALVDAGIAPLITEHIMDIANAMDAFVPAGGGDKSNLVTVDTIKEEQNGTLDLSSWKKVGGQKGSNPGGTYENPVTSEQVYVKTPKSQLHGENERLASALYEAAGISSARVFKGKLADGTEVTYSPMIEGAKPDLKKNLKNKEYMARLQQGFAIDALLANWDVIGLDYDNVVTDKNGEPVRVDPGGALLFRAQGSPKGGAFGEDVPELDAFTDPTSSRPAAKVFSQMTDEQKLESAKVLQNLSPSQIEELVNSIVTDPEKREELKTKLKARREAILGKFELSTKPAKKKNPEGGSSGKTTTLDVTGDNDSLKAQLEEAAKNGDLVSFKYNGKERIVAPTYVWTNPKNGNINLTGDEDGVSKNYTLQNFEQSSEAPSESPAPAETTVLDLGNDSIRAEAAKSIQTQLPDGYTATPEKGVGNTGFVMVKNAQGETVAMVTMDPDDKNKYAVQNFKAGWKIESADSLSEAMDKLVNATKVVEEPGQVVQLSDGSTGKMGAKVVHSKNGITGTIVGFQKDPNYVKVKPDNGDPIKIMSINQIKSNGSGGGGTTPPSTPDAPSAPKAPEAPKAETFIPQKSENMTLFTTANGGPSKVMVIKNSEGKWDVVYDFNGPDFKPLQTDIDDRDEAEDKALTALKANNFEPDASTESAPAKPSGPKKFTFDFMGLQDVEDAPEVKDSGDPLDGDNEQIKTDAAGTLIKPGAIVKDANGRMGVYRTPGYGDPNKIRMIWEDGTQDSVMPDTVTATGKYVSPGIAGVYAGLADLDFEKNSEPMPDNYTSWLKDKNGKGIGAMHIVIDKQGDMGVVVNSNGDNGYIQVAYPDGTKKRKADTVTALDTRYKKGWYNIKIAQKHFKNLNPEKFNLPTFGIPAKPGAKKAPSGKLSVPKNGAGAKPEQIEQLGWNESGFEGAPSLEELLAKVSDTSKPGSGLAGGSIALDADAVEDLDLRVMAATSTDGKDAYLMKYKLTSWAGDDLANKLLEMVENNDPRVSVTTGLSVPENLVTGDKVSFMPSLNGKAASYKSGYGQTFVITLDDGTKIYFLRADVPTKHTSGQAKISSNGPRAYHNKVMVIAPKESSTPESLALALNTAGVQDVRPSTKADAKILIENRLMSIFDEKVDPKSNLSGSERALSLERIKAKWGIGPDNVTITTGAGGRIEMRLDPESAKKIASKTGIKVLLHTLRSASRSEMQGPKLGETEEQARDRIADYFADRVATPQGGLLATTTRWSEGIPTSGQSSSRDVETGGADYVFTTPRGNPSTENSRLLPGIWFDAERTFQRLDFWANQSDQFGKRVGKSPIDQAVPGGYEVMFKGRLSFDDAAVLMVKDEDMRTRVITKLRQKGITEIGGRPLEAVVMTGPQYSAAKNTVK